MKEHHYTESGLDTVYLVNGYDFIETPQGKGLRIRNINGLHRAIGGALVKARRPLSGAEVRFLRVEMLLSQQVLGEVLGVTEQTIARWEKGKTLIPRAADAALRAIYVEYAFRKNAKLSDLLREIADNEDAFDQRIRLEEIGGRWAA